ncbi:MAG: Rpn family recombination-promoting nuclease/putative transposase, partial [Leptospiraceae bacterium]|nr:Rpn family recombination-promoting nuclease/putative transposase [Leptospiraceae bacterium]
MNHNSFFKVTFQSRENVIDFLKHRLPSELLKDISLDTLEIAKDSFIDPNYRDIQSD